MDNTQQQRAQEASTNSKKTIHERPICKCTRRRRKELYVRRNPVVVIVHTDNNAYREQNEINSDDESERAELCDSVQCPESSVPGCQGPGPGAGRPDGSEGLWGDR